MSDKPASPAFGSPRAPAIVAVICVGMVIVAAAGALMLFTAPGGGDDHHADTDDRDDRRPARGAESG